MKSVKFIAAGMLFGILLVKSEVASWFRIQEMFRFQAFHMYGIIGTGVILGVIFLLMSKKFNWKDSSGNPIVYPDKEPTIKRYLYGGIIFGLGWALAGACPGPVFVNFGYGYTTMIFVIIGALFGTYLYGLVQKKLPH